jgi:integrase
MASVIRRYDKRPIPPNAEFITRRGERLARYKDTRGRTQTQSLSEDGTVLLIPRRHWYIVYFDATGRRRFVKAYVDKEASEKLARDLERQAARAKAGLEAADRKKTHAPIAEALKLYLEDLERQGRAASYVYNSSLTMNQIIKGCHWTTMPTIKAEGLTSWLASAKKQGKAPRTLNYYLGTARKFVAWCIDHDYLEGSPIARIRKAEEKGEKRRIRRALSPEQLALLLEVSGPRRLCYLTAMLTGLRRRELGKLRWTDLYLDDARPHIWLRPKDTKAKRDDIIPLPPELAEALRAARPANAGPESLVFPIVPKVNTFKKDLERAGIPYKDNRGRQADFHSLRMCFNMLLAKQDVPIRVAKQLMRHADIRLTAGAYTDPRAFDLNAAVESLPRIAKKSEQKGEVG